MRKPRAPAKRADTAMAALLVAPALPGETVGLLALADVEVTATGADAVVALLAGKVVVGAAETDEDVGEAKGEGEVVVTFPGNWPLTQFWAAGRRPSG